MFNFTLVNRSKAFTITYGLRLGLGIQINNHFAPIWGASAAIDGIVYALKVQVQNAGISLQDVPVYIDDTINDPTALGYHDIDSGGNPYIEVSVSACGLAGVPVSAVVSHEMLEVLGDPFVDSLVLKQDMQGPTLLPSGWLLDAEVCDPVEGDTYTIKGGVVVSNFITPAWFMPAPPTPVKYDYLGRLTAPFTMTAGGYFVKTQVGKIGQPEQVLGDKARPWNGKKG